MSTDRKINWSSTLLEYGLILLKSRASLEETIAEQQYLNICVGDGQNESWEATQQKNLPVLIRIIDKEGVIHSVYAQCQVGVFCDT